MILRTKQRSQSNLVLAVGNWYQQDDAIALILLERLKPHLERQVTLQATEEAGLTLLDFLVGFRNVILLDAIIREGEEGKVVELRLDDFQVHAMAAWHQMGIPEVLQMGKELRLPMPRNIFLLGITVNHCNWGVDGICSALQRKLPQLEENILAYIHRMFRIPARASLKTDDV